MLEVITTSSPGEKPLVTRQERQHGLHRHCVVVVIATALLCSSCQATASNQRTTINPATTLTETLNHKRRKRTYHIHLPPGFSQTQSAPLVFALHGGGGQGRRFDQQASQGTLTAAANERGVVLVFPEGVNRQWHDGRTAHLNTKQTIDDVGFIAKIIDRMVNHYGINPKRVYATGISNGGFMAVRLAMALTDT